MICKLSSIKSKTIKDVKTIEEHNNWEKILLYRTMRNEEERSKIINDLLMKVSFPAAWHPQ